MRDPNSRSAIQNSKNPLSAIAITATTDGVILPVHAQPGARRNGIVGEHAGRLKVAVTQAAEKGKANEAIVDVMADALGLKRTQIRLLSGETARQKTFLVSGMPSEALQARLVAILAAESP